MAAPLTIFDEARAMLQTIKDMQGDDEAAHSREDKLHVFVLQQIADKRTDFDGCQTLAKIALETLKLDFARYCA